MWVELSPPLTAAMFVVLTLALVAGVVRGTGGLRRRLPLRPLDERLLPAAVAERFVGYLRAEPDEAHFEVVNGVWVTVTPTWDVPDDAYTFWRVQIGAHTGWGFSHAQVYTLICERLSALEASVARGVAS